MDSKPQLTYLHESFLRGIVCVNCHSPAKNFGNWTDKATGFMAQAPFCGKDCLDEYTEDRTYNPNSPSYSPDSPIYSPSNYSPDEYNNQAL
jgi:hypothetical protein